MRSLEELQAQAHKMETEGIEEVIVAYRDLADLHDAAKLIKS